MARARDTSVALGVILVCCGFTIVSSAVYHSALPEKPEAFREQEGCYVNETNSVIQFGEMATPLGYCYRIECSRTALHYATCGVVVTKDSKCYKTEQDLSQPYPACCSTILCDTNDLL